MQEHTQTMQESMKTMRGMGGPMMMGSGQHGGMPAVATLAAFYNRGLQLISLSERGHFHLCVFEKRPELSHDFFFAMDQKRSRCAHSVMPCEQFIAVGVRGKSVDRMDACPHRNVFAKQMDGFRSIDDLTRERAFGRKADEDHAGILPPQIVLEMVAYPPACGHARSGQNHGTTADTIEVHRVCCLTGEMQAWQHKGIAAVSKFGKGFGIKAFRMTAENFSGRDCHG